jgi:hypothetical protein
MEADGIISDVHAAGGWLLKTDDDGDGGATDGRTRRILAGDRSWSADGHGVDLQRPHLNHLMRKKTATRQRS